MPAFGAVLILLGFFVLMRTIRHNIPLKKGGNGGLVEKLLGE